ncbi:hypothetical protein [Tenuifilum thalassicum]|uniref:Uncharacterized protein n=1 Tax=Tenuifilum thalassicum TaxID=2590900 RepID=A0A7D3XKW2_9BACT|nr:hypothetical protein [Tenuifilum thalassicum]QKG78916.1 hypothetical protein FHG85_01080 [Tenuifilum thalassicum]
MKRSTLMRIALVVTALFMFSGVFAQTHNSTIPKGYANSVTYGNDGSFYMVEGTTVPVYALPDPVYHPWDYASGTWTLTDGFTWNWAEGTTTLTFSQNGAPDNYVEITAPAGSAAGSPYTVTVYEQSPAAFGGCADATPTSITVNVVATPSATLGALAGASDSYCVGDASIPSAINATISGGWQNYRLVWRLEIATLDNNAAKDQYYDDETGAGASAVQKYAVNYTTASPEAVAASGAHDIMTVSSFSVINNKPTVYTYELISINDQALRFGDFITLDGDATDPSAFTYNAISETYTLQINPAPVTGPIYHIPTTWAN